jgi:hypothetical protein
VPRLLAVPAALPLALPFVLAGCAAEDDPGVAGEAVTVFTEPVPEEGQAEEAPDGGGAQPVAVELPGLPVGGDGAVFTEPSTRCVSVNLTGEPLPSGVQAVITRFTVPDQFAVSSGSCGLGLPVCLEGHPLSSATGPCEAAVTWSGEAVPDGEQPALGVGAAVAVCVDAATCEAALAVVSRASLEVVELFVEPS